MGYIHKGQVASIIEDVCDEANRTLDTGFTVYAEDSLRYALRKAMVGLHVYTRDEIEESGEILESRGEDDTYYSTQDVIDAFDDAWQYAEVSVDNLIYTRDGVDIALEYSNEAWQALGDYGYSMDSFESLEDILFQAAACYADQVANELVSDGIDNIKAELENYSV